MLSPSDVALGQTGEIHMSQSSTLIPGGLPHTPFVSVVMNCFNSDRYLEKALESVRAQTFSDWEIVFWDNRSTDESAEIFKRFNDPRFRYFLAPEHTILGKAKALAIEKARGGWLAFLDCDDLWLPHKLERQVSLIADANLELGLVYGRMAVLVEDEARKTSVAKSAIGANLSSRNRCLPEGDVFAQLLQENFVPQPSAMVRRAAYCAVGGVNPEFKFSWDYDLFVRISRDWKVGALQEVCCQYRIHGNNLTHTQKEKGYQESINIASRYLPDPVALQAVRIHESIYAGYELYNGRILAGVSRLLGKGNLLSFTGKLISIFWRAIQVRIKHMKCE